MVIVEFLKEFGDILPLGVSALTAIGVYYTLKLTTEQHTGQIADLSLATNELANKVNNLRLEIAKDYASHEYVRDVESKLISELRTLSSRIQTLTDVLLTGSTRRPTQGD